MTKPPRPVSAAAGGERTSRGSSPPRKLIQRQARALGDPTRYDIFRYVADASAPVRVATLVEQFGLNYNAVRQHLAKLTEAGLLTEERGAPTTGRPPLQYRVTPAAMGAWGAPGPYELLAVLLLDVAKGTHTPVEAGAVAGRRAVSRYEPGSEGLDILEAEMASRGFEPRREMRGKFVELVLDRCPFEAAACADPDIVCEVHRGIAEGILEAMGSDYRVRRLIAYPPKRAGCRLQMEQLARNPARPEAR